MTIQAKVSFTVECDTVEEAVTLVAEAAETSFGDKDFTIITIEGDADDTVWVGVVVRTINSEFSVKERRIARQVGGYPPGIAEMTAYGLRQSQKRV